MFQAFSPIGNTSTVATVASASTAATALPGDPDVVATAAVHNSGNAVAFIRFGGSGVVAAATDIVLPPNSLVILALGIGVTHYAVFSGTGSMNIYVQRGGGQ
jgi:hypothetical protein